MAPFETYLNHLGVMAWPLLCCLTLTLIILIERLANVAINAPWRDRWLKRLDCQNPLDCPALEQQLSGRRSLLSRGTQMLLGHASQDKALREEIAGLWLLKQKRQLMAGLKVLMVIGIISPMMGLLGTVLGLIQMFQEIGASNGPVTPAQLADGLGLAMYTTAAGLIIALPAVGGAHLLTLWAERQLGKTEHVLNRINLWLSGIAPRSQQEIAA
ncbi:MULTISPECIES: MotA/TolQ/ExbB proton channel family protein [Ferrimonas]|uniref:MotA/TolQ/ExbB proton channel family protein n=1 Tax=Ferrimonas TaxID=44011 RepID=UPI0003FBD4DF|nr:MULTISPECIES: MotA/TolQ/ExbB proton channel family protein [Ferrimonas]USD38878.1 MotA/TolQ/ExbB proton channel family protein [Ferrimonas sp. SCSIO 43195]